MTLSANGYADLLPPLSTDEFAALKADIKANGVRVAVDVDEDGTVLDGHHRLKIDPKAKRRVVGGLSDGEKIAFVFRANLARRNLSPSQWAELRPKLQAAAKRLRAEGRTQLQTARLLGVSREWTSKWEGAHDGTRAKMRSPLNLSVKVPAAEHAEIERRIAAGESQVQVAADYRIGRQQVGRIATKERKQQAEQIVHREAIANVRPLSVGERCGVILCDPPWRYNYCRARAFLYYMYRFCR